MDNILLVLILFAAIGCGLNAGLFFIFSNTVMNALGSLKPSNGIAAMQSINRVILNPLFFLVFMGTAVNSIILIAISLWKLQTDTKIYLLSACMFYLIGCMLITIVKNVPMNNALDKVDPESSEGAELWNDYLKRWTAWNHVRTIACVLAAILFTIALRIM